MPSSSGVAAVAVLERGQSLPAASASASAAPPCRPSPPCNWPTPYGMRSRSTRSQPSSSSTPWRYVSSCATNPTAPYRPAHCSRAPRRPFACPPPCSSPPLRRGFRWIRRLVPPIRSARWPVSSTLPEVWADGRLPLAPTQSPSSGCSRSTAVTCCRRPSPKAARSIPRTAPDTPRWLVRALSRFDGTTMTVRPLGPAAGGRVLWR